MRTSVLAIVAVMAASSAMAEDTTTAVNPLMTGELSLNFAETAAGKTAGTMALDLDINAGGVATVDLGLKATDGNAVTLDTWTVGTDVNGVALSFGDDHGLLPETAASAAADGTLAVPTMTESLQLGVAGATVAVGLTDWTADVTDISNIQGAYTLGNVSLSGDYNMDSDNTVLGASVTGIDLGMVSAGSALTYDVDAETFAYEGSVATGGLSAYLNGTDDNRLQNIGGEYEVDVNGATFTAGANYDLDDEDLTPTASLSFNF
jgi:hypothetical protein